MNPKQYGLNKTFEESEYNSSLEVSPNAPQGSQSDGSRHGFFSPFDHNKAAFRYSLISLIIIVLIAVGGFLISGSIANTPSSPNKAVNYGVSSLPLMLLLLEILYQDRLL